MIGNPTCTNWTIQSLRDISNLVHSKFDNLKLKIFNVILKTQGESMDNHHAEFMKEAIKLSREASIVKKTGGVFGAVVVKDGKIIGKGYNQVIKNNDPTWHAEIEAIRDACKKLGTPHLDGCILYSSAECCPMCLAAAYWAKISKIYHGATTGDALKYGEFADIDILDEMRKDPQQRRIPFIEIMRPEAVEVWKEFSVMPDRARY
jgi:guanine deaminase